jgi:GntR family transcriptional repressor for pyruvate dehydrogenase complex
MVDHDRDEIPPQIKILLEDVFFRKAHWHSAYEVAIQRLAQAIKLGALKSGARLPPERELVERLGISRTTLREGIRALQQQGYLKTSRGRSGGTFTVQAHIRQPTKVDIRRIAKEMGSAIPGLLDMRAAVEPKAAELAASRADEATIENLRWLAERAKHVLQLESRQADSTLHIAIAHAAGSDRLLDLVLEEQMRLHELLAYLALGRVRGQERHSSAHQHTQVVDAIALHDPTLAYRAMREHIEATNAVLSDLLKLNGPRERAFEVVSGQPPPHS